MIKKNKYDSDASYLGKLKFDKNLLNTFTAKFLRTPRLIFLIILAIIVAGTGSFLTLPRELNPQIDIPLVSVTTALPGASPLIVEQLITKPLEKEINTLSDIESISSSSRESISQIIVTFTSITDSDDALMKVRERVESVTTLPDEAVVPRVVKLDFNDQPILTVAIAGEMDRRSLSMIAERIKDEAENIASIRRVSISGQEIEEIRIEINDSTLNTYGLSSSQIAAALISYDTTIPVGLLTVNQTNYQVALDTRLHSISAVRQIPIRSGQQVVSLSDIANIYLSSEPSSNITYYRDADDQGSSIPAVEISFFKTRSATIDQASQQAREASEKVLIHHPQVKKIIISDTSTLVSDQFGDLESNFASTIFLVFLILLIFTGARQAIIAALSIPLTFLSAFSLMQFFGVTLNFLSLFSLLLALGLIVDDAIVIVQAMYRYGKRFKPLEAGLLVLKDFFIPIWTTTLTTVWAFLPLVLATGIIGEFIRTIPIVVTAALLSSTAIAVGLTLPLLVLLRTLGTARWLLRIFAVITVITATLSIIFLMPSSPLSPFVITSWFMVLLLLLWNRKMLQSKSKALWGTRKLEPVRKGITEGFIDFSIVSLIYRDMLNRIITRKKYRILIYTISASFLTLSIVFAATGLLKREFFPQTDQDELYINVEGPSGWRLQNTLEVMQIVEEDVLTIPDVKYLVSATDRTFSSMGSGLRGEHLGNVTVLLTPGDQRVRTSSDIAADLRSKFDTFPQAKVSVIQQSAGPPVGADLEVNITGEDLMIMEQVANDFVDTLITIPGAVNIESSLSQTPGQITVVVDPEQLAKRDLSPQQIAGWLRTAVSGSSIINLTSDELDHDVVIRYSQDDISLSKLQNLKLPSAMGGYSLAEIARFELETSPAVIDRQNLKRQVVVSASAQDISANDLLNSFEEVIKDYPLPSEISWSVGGVNEENQASTNSIIQAMGVSAILILATMVLQLNSFRQAVLVMVVIPMAITGVFFNFTIFRIPLSFPALIGALALFGIVVNNSILLIEKINQNIRFGLRFTNAIVDACSSRIEAIFFTSITTAVGLLPITIADPFWRGLGGAIIAGLSVSGIFILFLLPALYYEVYPNKQKSS